MFLSACFALTAIIYISLQSIVSNRLLRCKNHCMNDMSKQYTVLHHCKYSNFVITRKRFYSLYANKMSGNSKELWRNKVIVIAGMFCTSRGVFNSMTQSSCQVRHQLVNLQLRRNCASSSMERLYQPILYKYTSI